MRSFYGLLRSNRNYRCVWLGQVVSEVGDHFNTIAVLSLTLKLTGSGSAVGGVMIARTICAIIAAPIAGITLDRLDRRHVMIASDLARAVIAACFTLVLLYGQDWLLYVLSGLLMFATPFFNSGRSAVLPKITAPHELHTANALTQTTSWLTLSLGTMLGGIGASQFGYKGSLGANAISFLVSAVAIWMMRSPDGHFRAPRKESDSNRQHRSHAWTEFTESLAYMRQRPLLFAIGLAGVGWASGGGAAQVLFTLYGEIVFNRGPGGIGLLWSFAGIGLVIGGILGHWLGKRLSYQQYLRAVGIGFAVHGLAYVLFAIGNLAMAVLFIAVSRVAMGSFNVLNRTALLTHTDDAYRGRVFTTVDGMMQATMMLSLTAASVATVHFPIRTIGVVAGLLSASSAIFWLYAVLAHKLPEPRPHTEPEPPIEAQPVTPA
ncbi:MAG TPA: MFS transporter [Bryobacteraceae bacterium]|nr:MFS transporter [Bryobacteraceae bacterium]